MLGNDPTDWLIVALAVGVVVLACGYALWALSW